MKRKNIINKYDRVILLSLVNQGNDVHPEIERQRQDANDKLKKIHSKNKRHFCSHVQKRKVVNFFFIKEF